MGEIIDLENFRRQRKRYLVETTAAANRRNQNRDRTERERVRPAVEPLDRGRGSLDPAAGAKPDDKPAE
jgi:hypothetical protein